MRRAGAASAGGQGKAPCYMAGIIDPCLSTNGTHWCASCTRAYLDAADAGGLSSRQRVPGSVLDPAVAAARAPGVEPVRPSDSWGKRRPTHPVRTKRFANARFAVGRPAVILSGGPRDGWGYYRDDWSRMLAHAEQAGRPLPYRRTDRWITHPGSDPAVRSQVWEYVDPGER